MALNTRCASRAGLRRTDSARKRRRRPARAPSRARSRRRILFRIRRRRRVRRRAFRPNSISATGRSGSRSRDISRWRNKPSRPPPCRRCRARSSFSMSAMISAMYSVARGLTCGSRQPSAFKSSRKAVSNLPVNSRSVVLFSRTRLMILSSTSVMFMTCCHLVAGKFQRAADEVGEDERAPVADVGEVIDRRPAAIHPGFFPCGSSGANSCTERVSVLNSFKAICSPQIKRRRAKAKAICRATKDISRNDAVAATRSCDAPSQPVGATPSSRDKPNTICWLRRRGRRRHALRRGRRSYTRCRFNFQSPAKFPLPSQWLLLS